MKNKIITIDKLASIRKKYSNKKIVHCHGVYDMLHHGHFLHLYKAQEMGDIIIVTVTSDQFVNKGPKRPYFSQNQKDMMSDVIPYFNNSLIEEMNNTLMRESLRNIK